MANKNIFSSVRSGQSQVPATDTYNEAGGQAYSFTPEHALAQMAATGCLNGTYYTTAASQLDTVLALCKKLDSKYIGQVAVFARERGYMKDMPALLCAVLASKDVGVLEKVFPRVCDSGKMVRNFVQMIASGKLGRQNFGHAPRRLIQNWLDSKDDRYVFNASVGNDPSLADVLKMIHPKPKNKTRSALYGYIIGKLKDENKRYLPDIVKSYESYKNGKGDGEVPNVDFRLLTALDLGTDEWTQIALRAPWHELRMNLNTFERHGVLKSDANVKAIANRLRDPELIAKAKVFPYQLMVAYNSTTGVDSRLRNALQDAMEIAIENVPEIDGKVYVFPDVSGSMSGAAVTGDRGSATSAVRCIDVAALVTATVLRKNKDAEVIPFGTSVCQISLNPRDSVMTNAEKLAAIRGGGTNCSAPLRLLNERKAKGDLVIYVSDYESWVDSGRGRGSATMVEWTDFKSRNKGAKMVCIDLTPHTTTQAQDRKDIMNIGGFSDQVFDSVAEFARGEMGSGHWVGEVKKVQL